jgi:Ca2+-binding EF-hand superfamily protein
MGAFWQLRQFDTTGDMLVDEKELNAGIDKAKARADEATAILLKAFDANADQKISAEESQKIREFIGTLMTMPQYDRNGDWQIDDEEMKGAFDQLADAAQQQNDNMLQRFDKDADGKISPEEATAAKAEMQAQWQRGPRREGGAQRREGGQGQPPPGQPPPGGQGQPPPPGQPPAGQPAPAPQPKPNP